jgi:hypothetical protein
MGPDVLRECRLSPVSEVEVQELLEIIARYSSRMNLLPRHNSKRAKQHVPAQLCRASFKRVTYRPVVSAIWTTRIAFE